MTMETAIQARWAADAALCTLVPAERFYTGLALGAPPPPYVVLERKSETPVAHASSGKTIARSIARFTVWSASRVEADSIAAAIRARFQRVDFVQDDFRVLNMQHASSEDERLPDGAWRLAVDYAVLWSGF